MRSIRSVLVTGGLGFIGSHVVDLLLEKGCYVRVLDNLDPQVHGDERNVPNYFNSKAELVIGDLKDRNTVKRSVEDSDAVVHLAAAVGVGQSMYQIERYVSCNTCGTASLLDIIVNGDYNVKKLVVASSMSVYGEGKYSCERCGIVYPSMRDERQLKNREWELKCPSCGRSVKPEPTDEEKPPMPTSIYAQTKRHQEEMCLLIAKAYGIPTVALRFFNVYGTRQSLRNPYTGVCAILISRLLNEKPPYIFEDGFQTRDFIHANDVARAVILALERSRCDYKAVNVGTGKPTSIRSIAETLTRIINPHLNQYISYTYRKGDIRHGYADTNRAENLMDYYPSVTLEDGLRELIEWAVENKWSATDLFENAMEELAEKRLTSR